VPEFQIEPLLSSQLDTPVLELFPILARQLCEWLNISGVPASLVVFFHFTQRLCLLQVRGNFSIKNHFFPVSAGLKLVPVFIHRIESLRRFEHFSVNISKKVVFIQNQGYLGDVSILRAQEREAVASDLEFKLNVLSQVFGWVVLGNLQKVIQSLDRSAFLFAFCEFLRVFVKFKGLEIEVFQMGVRGCGVAGF
jgi:hypothetical protein